MTALHTDTVRAWDGPAAVAPRGTLIVIPGRGEHAGVYERFGTRIAVDGYRVRAVADPTRDPAGVRRTIEDLLADEDLPRPHVLVGSDTGAVFAVVEALAARDVAGIGVDGLVLSGLVDADSVEPQTAGADAQWDDELETRTACPTHQARLAADDRLERGALERRVPTEWLAGADLGQVAVPVLALHGEDDRISPLERVRATYAEAPSVELTTIVGGRHDTLNDATHRTAAATVVLFLERLRLGPQLPAIARSAG